jgi:hypothetical protein
MSQLKKALPLLKSSYHNLKEAMHWKLSLSIIKYYFINEQQCFIRYKTRAASLLNDLINS